jgi:hypothetical protein
MCLTIKKFTNIGIQEDFEMAVAKIMQKDSEKNMSIKKLFK